MPACSMLLRLTLPGVLATTMAIEAQTITFGAVTGTNLTQDFRTLRYPFTFGDRQYVDATYSDSRSFIAGPMIEIGFSRRWSLEADALYRRLQYRTESDFPLMEPFEARVPTWEGCVPNFQQKQIWVMMFQSEKTTPPGGRERNIDDPKQG